MTFEEAYKQLPEGWMGMEDARALWEEARKVEGLIVEIGSYLGRSTKLMALASPNSQIITIDPYLMGYYPSCDMEQVRDQFLINTTGLNVSLIQDLSKNVGKGWNRPIDFFHDDGNHSYTAVKQDIRFFIPHLKKGGVAMFHDYYANGNPDTLIGMKDDRYYDKKYGVVRAINESRKHFSSIILAAGFAKCIK